MLCTRFDAIDVLELCLTMILRAVLNCVVGTVMSYYKRRIDLCKDNQETK
jgi:hypothetical protein